MSEKMGPEVPFDQQRMGQVSKGAKQRLHGLSERSGGGSGGSTPQERRKANARELEEAAQKAREAGDPRAARDLQTAANKQRAPGK